MNIISGLLSLTLSGDDPEKDICGISQLARGITVL